MTMQEAKQTMRYMESVFDVVRLLEADTLREIHYGDYTSKEPKAPCQCYDFWEKSSPCENCVSIRALEEKNVLFGGRLGMYRYMDMDQVIEEALAMAETELAYEEA